MIRCSRYYYAMEALVQSLMCRAIIESGLPLKEVARRMDMKKSKLRKLLSGGANPRIDTVANVFAACGFDLEFSIVKRKDGAS